MILNFNLQRANINLLQHFQRNDNNRKSQNKNKKQRDDINDISCACFKYRAKKYNVAMPITLNLQRNDINKY